MLVVAGSEIAGAAPVGAGVYSLGGGVRIVDSVIVRNTGDFGAVVQEGPGRLDPAGGAVASDQPVIGGSAGDRLQLGDGGQIAQGRGGDDFLSGGAQSDVLAGGAGNDTLAGQSGSDVLQNGAGTDVFAFFATDEGGVDRVTDFDAGRDIIALDDRSFGRLVGDGINPRAVTQDQARAALQSDASRSTPPPAR